MNSKDLELVKLVEIISNDKNIVAPSWATFVKTSSHKERTPDLSNWWQIRAASILRKVRKEGPVGVNSLSKSYGGRKDRGFKPERKVNSSRNIIRKIFSQLEKAGLVQNSKIEKKPGKVLTKKGADVLRSSEVQK